MWKILVALLSLLYLCAAQSFAVYYAPNSPHEYTTEGAIDFSDASDDWGAYGAQVYKLYRGEKPTYSIRILTFSTGVSNLYVVGDFVIPNLSCNASSAPRTGHTTAQKTKVNLSNSAYQCNPYTPILGKSGHLYFASIPANTIINIVMTSTWTVPCTQSLGTYGTLSFQGRAGSLVSNLATTTLTVVNNSIGACINCSQPGVCSDGLKCSLDTCDPVVWGCRHVCPANMTCLPDFSNCTCAPGSGTIQDEPAGCGFDLPKCVDCTATQNTSVYCDRRNDLIWRIKNSPFDWAGTNFTYCGNIPMNKTALPPNYVPNYRGGSEDWGLRNPVDVGGQIDGYAWKFGSVWCLIAWKDNLRAGQTWWFSLTVQPNCTFAKPGTPEQQQIGSVALRNQRPGWPFHYANQGEFIAVYWVLANPSVPRLKRSVDPEAVDPTPVDCLSSLSVQQTLAESWIEDGVDYSKWFVNISTTTEPLYSLDFAVLATEGQEVRSLYGVAEIDGRLQITDAHFAQAIAVPPNTNIQDFGYIVTGRQQAEFKINEAVCTGSCATSVTATPGPSNLIDDVFTRTFNYEFTNNGVNKAKFVSIDLNFDSADYDVSFLNIKAHSTRISGTDFNFVVDLENLPPSQTIKAQLSVSVPASKGNLGHPLITVVEFACA